MREATEAQRRRGEGAKCIRVARVIARLNIGGPAQHVILLTAGLDPARFATTLITGVVGGAEGDFTDEARARGVEPMVIPELGRDIRPGRDLRVLVKLIRLFRRLQPDIVHTHTAKAGALGRVAAWLAGVPITIHTFHGHVLDGYFSSAVTRIFISAERILARLTDRLITVSPRLRTQILGMGIGRPEQLEVVPLGLNLQRFRQTIPRLPILRPYLGVAQETPLCGIVGRLVPIKDHAMLFEAMARLQSADRLPHLVVIGDGEERARLEGLAECLGLRERIHFLGWRSDLETILGELDVVVCASKNEGTPVALIEAMAAGVPVLSTDVGGVADLVSQGQTGWLVPAGDPAAMALAISDLLGDPALRARLATAGQSIVLERHDATGLVRRTEALYESLINEKLGVDVRKPVTAKSG
jgi:glycosyltransferase involved in cell wall biosynthesis